MKNTQNHTITPFGLGSTTIAKGKNIIIDYGSPETPLRKMICRPSQEHLDHYLELYGTHNHICSVDDLTRYEIQESFANGCINYKEYKTLISYKKTSWRTY